MRKLRKGKVRWWDSLRGEGLIRDTKGDSYRINWQAIADQPRGNRDLTQGENVVFTLLIDSHYTAIDYLIRES